MHCNICTESNPCPDCLLSEVRNSNTVQFKDILKQYIEQERMRFEGEKGVRNLSRIAEVMGYKQGLLEMLADNSCLQESILEALEKQHDFGKAWTRNLSSEVLGLEKSLEPDETRDEKFVFVIF